jgi:hypothetical protein
MAVVYSAIEKDLDRPVAIKVVRHIAGDTEGLVQRLENEARGLAALHHPHIVDLYRFGRTEDGSLYYVMPLLTGGSLEEVPRPLPEDQVVALLDHLLDALEHAHGADIIHRDIKPANILFDRFKRPMLADFGAAFMRQRETRLTTHGEAIGSSGYMSPEQARGHAVDARSDLYSVAVLAFELLTGQRPFEGEDALSTALAQIEKPVPRLPEALRHWQSFFYRALAVNPEHRYVSAASMRAAIHALPRGGGAYGDWRWKTWLLPLLATALVLAGIAFAIGRPKPPAAPVTVAQKHKSMVPGTQTPPVVQATASSVAAATPPVEAEKPKEAAVGDRFSDPNGPEMVVAKAPTHAHGGLAITAAAVDAPLYQRFMKATGHRKYLRCEAGPVGAQGCLDLATGNDIARWLSKETGERYRVPSRGELDAGIAQVVRSKGYAWTGTCNEVRVARPRNAAQRGWSKVRKAFGKPKPVEYDLRCDGHFTLKLDGEGKQAIARVDAVPEAVVVLVREMKKSTGT